MSETKKTTTVVVSKKQPKKNARKRVRKEKLNVQNPLVRAPVATARAFSNNQSPRFLMPPRREFIVSVPGSTNIDFELKNTLIMNPGDPLFSPWAANIAKNFESYIFRKLRFRYVPRCSTSSNGYMGLSPDMNPHDVPPTSQQEACQNERCKTDSTWREIVIDIPHEMLNKRKTYFCRKAGSIPIGADKDLYDTGNLHVFCAGQGNGNLHGQVWVEYQVEFFTPESSSSSDVTTFVNSDPVGRTSVQPFGNNPVLTQVGEVINNVSSDGTQNILNFAKDFHGMLTTRFAGTGLTNPVLTALSGATVNIVEDGVNLNNAFATAGGGGAIINSLIEVTKGGKIGLSLPSITTLTSAALGLTPCLL